MGGEASFFLSILAQRIFLGQNDVMIWWQHCVLGLIHNMAINQRSSHVVPFVKQLIEERKAYVVNKRERV